MLVACPKCPACGGPASPGRAMCFECMESAVRKNAVKSPYRSTCPRYPREDESPGWHNIVNAYEEALDT